MIRVIPAARRRRTKHVALLLIVAALLPAGACVAAGSPGDVIPGLAILSSRVKHDYPTLGAERARLVRLIANFNARTSKFNADCSSIDASDVPAVQSCGARQAALQAEKSRIAASILAFNTDVRRLPAKHPSEVPGLDRSALSLGQRLALLDAQYTLMHKQLSLINRVLDQQHASAQEMSEMLTSLNEDTISDAFGLLGSAYFWHELGITGETRTQLMAIADGLRDGIHLVSAANADAASGRGSAEARQRAQEKVRALSISFSKRLLVMTDLTSAQRRSLGKIVELANEAINGANTITGAESTRNKALLFLDSLSRAAGVISPAAGAYRSAGDLTADAYVHWTLYKDRQSVSEAEHSAQYARGKWMSRMDQMNRQRQLLRQEYRRPSERPCC